MRRASFSRAPLNARKLQVIRQLFAIFLAFVSRGIDQAIEFIGSHEIAFGRRRLVQHFYFRQSHAMYPSSIALFNTLRSRIMSRFAARSDTAANLRPENFPPFKRLSI